jgi:hypothetical protein
LTSIAGSSVAGSTDRRDRRRAGRSQSSTVGEAGIPGSLGAILHAGRHIFLREPEENIEYV